MVDVQAYEQRISTLEQELEEMTEALSQAWDQLTPFLEETPQTAESAEDLTPIIHALSAGADAGFAGAYLFEHDEWVAVPENTPLPPEVRARLRTIKPSSLRYENFYANVPMRWAFVPIVSEDDVTGVLGVGTTHPERTLTAVELRIALRMAERVGSQISAAKLARVRTREAALRREMQIAREIQQSVQPLQPPQGGGVRMSVHWQPARQVGGDTWGWIETDEAMSWFMLDVAGKGLPAALAAVSLHTAIRMALRMGLSPAEVLHVVNDELYEAYTRTDLMATVAVLAIHPRTGEIEIANAGHPPILVRRGHKWLRIPASAPPVGVLPELIVDTERLRLYNGDLVIVHSDGFSEIETPTRQWGQTGLLGAVASQMLDPEVILHQIVEQSRLVGEVTDDQTLIVTLVTSG